jgi:hypothetical protein
MVGGLNALKEVEEAATLQDRVEAVRLRVAAACARVGTGPESVALMAVTKAHGPDRASEIAEAGIRLMGESRVQEAAQKIPQCPGSIEWHFIGHLQTNKTNLAVSLFEMIHSVDSIKLLNSVETAASAQGRNMPVCLQVNVSGEGSKHGFNPDEVPAVLEQAQSLTHVTVSGLMTIPPFASEPETARPHFVKLRALRDAWRQESGFALDVLSMGMSHDYEVAIEEGSTCVRIGTAICGPREKVKRGEG